MNPAQRWSVIHGDCRDVALPSGVAAIITDPPYGIGWNPERSGFNRSRKAGGFSRWARTGEFAPIQGDDAPFDPSPWLGHAPLLAFFGANYCADLLPPSRCWIVWNKRDGIGPNNQADCELVWTNLKKPSRIYDHLWSGLLRAGEENVAKAPKYHPHQKPVALLRFIIRYMDLPAGSLICDPYCGSGSTGVAAIREGMRFIGVEVDAGYADTARRRIADEAAQTNLFNDAA